MSEENLLPFDAAHQDAWALLPWFCNGTLESAEHARVAQHLRGCLVCRRELERLQVLASHTVAPRGSDECEAALHRLSLRLDRAPTARPRQMPWAAAAMVTLCVTLLGWTADNAESSTAWLRNAGFSMVADPAREVPGEPLGPHVNLVFYDDITERELRSLVLAVGAVVVEGPTPQGVYTLAFARQMSPGEVLEALRKLRYSRRVLFAEPATNRRVSNVAGW